MNTGLLFSETTEEMIQEDVSTYTLQESLEGYKVATIESDNADMQYNAIERNEHSGDVALTTVEEVSALVTSVETVSDDVYKATCIALDSTCRTTGFSFESLELTDDTMDKADLEKTVENFFGDLAAGIARLTRKSLRTLSTLATKISARTSKLAKMAKKIKAKMKGKPDGDGEGLTIKSGKVGRWYKDPAEATDLVNTYVGLRGVVNKQQAIMKGLSSDISDNGQETLENTGKTLIAGLDLLGKVSGVETAEAKDGDKGFKTYSWKRASGKWAKAVTALSAVAQVASSSLALWVIGASTAMATAVAIPAAATGAFFGYWTVFVPIRWVFAKRVQVMSFTQVQSTLDGVIAMADEPIDFSGIVKAYGDVEKMAKKLSKEGEDGANAKAAYKEVLKSVKLYHKLGLGIARDSVAAADAATAYAVKSLKVLYKNFSVSTEDDKAPVMTQEEVDSFNADLDILDAFFTSEEDLVEK